MEFKIFVKITEALLALAGVKEDEEYDVHLPNFLLAFGFALIAAAIKRYSSDKRFKGVSVFGDIDPMD